MEPHHHHETKNKWHMKRRPFQGCNNCDTGLADVSVGTAAGRLSKQPSRSDRQTSSSTLRPHLDHCTNTLHVMASRHLIIALEKKIQMLQPPLRPNLPAKPPNKLAATACCKIASRSNHLLEVVASTTFGVNLM
jgi:hypothetical protein